MGFVRNGFNKFECSFESSLFACELNHSLSKVTFFNDKFDSYKVQVSLDVALLGKNNKQIILII